MTGGQQGNGHGELPEDGRLVVVRVNEAVTSALTGRSGVSYESPPQPRQHALALVELLLGRPTNASGGETRWSCPVAGGRRTIALESRHAIGGETR